MGLRYKFLSVILILQFSLGVSSQDVIPSDIPAIKFFDNATESQHILSPNGKYLAFIHESPRKYFLEVTDLDKSEIIHSTVISNEYPKNLTWISENRLLFQAKGSIFGINADGTDLQLLISFYDKESKSRSFKSRFRSWWIESPLLNDSEHILVKSVDWNDYQDVHKVNTYTGEKTQLLDGKKHKINRWLIDHNGEVRFALRNKKDNFRFFKFENEQILPIESSDSRVNFDFSGKSFLSKRVHILSYGDDKNDIYIQENLDRDKFRVVLYNLLSGESNVIHQDDRYDVGDIGAPALLLRMPYDKNLIGLQYKSENMKSVWFDERLEKIQNFLDDRYENKTNRIIDVSSDYDRVLVLSYDDKSQGRVFVYTVNSKKIAVQIIHPPEIDANLLSNTKVIRYVNREGVELEAMFTLPINLKADEKFPLIVYPHGGPYARSHRGYDGYIQYFVSRGYGVIQPNFRGSVGYGREHLLAGKNGIHTTMIDDIADSVKWALLNGANPEHINIFGISYGGYAAIMSGIKYPELYRTSASLSAPLDIGDQLKYYKKNELFFAYEFWNDIVIGMGNKNKKSTIKNISPIFQKDKISIPTLIVHGEYDSIVPVKQAEKFKKVNKKKYVEVLTLKDEGHGLRMRSNKLFLIRKLEALFAENRESSIP